MAEDPKFRFVIEGESKDAVDKVDKVVNSLNKLKASESKYSKERQQLARQERNDRFKSLSDSEKQLKLTQRQLTLEKQLMRARAQGNGGRVSALELLIARNKSNLRGLSDQSAGGKPTGNQASISDLLSRFSGIGKAVGIGYALKKVYDTVQQSIEFADSIGDLADQTGLTRGEILQVMKSANASGVSANKALAGISTLSAARGNAIAGDETALATFARYGITKKMLEGDISNLKVGMLIVDSLGNKGMTPGDRVPFGTLFGRRPEGTAAVLGGIQNQESPDTIAALKRLEDTKNWQESFSNRMKIIAARVSAKVLDFYSPVLDPFSELLNPTQDPGSAPLELKKRTAASSVMEKAKKKTAAGVTNSQYYGLPYRDVMQADQLARVGASSGARDPEGVGMLRKQLKSLQEIEKNTKGSAKAIEDVL